MIIQYTQVTYKMKRCIAIFLLISSSVGAAVTNQQKNNQTSTLAAPHGGWNYSGLIDHASDARTSYPFSPINRGTQRNRTLIQGHLTPLDKAQNPTLVVNGNPMLLNSDEAGNFQRHYAFGTGSNGVQLKTAHKHKSKKIQFYEANANQPIPKLRIICAWNAPTAEVDLHIITPDGQHITYYQPILKNGGGLDLDSVDGPGPEMFTTVTPLHGTYNVYVNYWGNFDENVGYNFDASRQQKPIVTTRITLVFNENTPNEKREDFVVPLRKIGELNLVKSFIY